MTKVVRKGNKNFLSLLHLMNNKKFPSELSLTWKFSNRMTFNSKVTKCTGCVHKMRSRRVSLSFARQPKRILNRGTLSTGTKRLETG